MTVKTIEVNKQSLYLKPSLLAENAIESIANKVDITTYQGSSFYTNIKISQKHTCKLGVCIQVTHNSHHNLLPGHNAACYNNGIAGFLLFILFLWCKFML